MVTRDLSRMPVIARREMTAADYFAMPDTPERFELIEGVLVQMPSPTSPHQRIGLRIGRAFLDLEEEQGGVALIAPMDVELSFKTVFQPDVAYVAPGHEDIVRSHVNGAPDVVVEVASPSTKTYDVEEKLPLYATYGVREAWIVDPVKRAVTVHHAEDGRFVSSETVAFGEPIPSRIAPVGDAGLGDAPPG